MTKATHVIELRRSPRNRVEMESDRRVPHQFFGENEPTAFPRRLRPRLTCRSYSRACRDSKGSIAIPNGTTAPEWARGNVSRPVQVINPTLSLESRNTDWDKPAEVL